MFRTKRLSLTGLAAAVSLLAFSTACGQQSSAPAQPQQPAAPASTQSAPAAKPADNLAPIKIGMSAILSGPAADNGEFCTRGAKLAVEEVNNAGGVQVSGESGRRKIDLIVEDDQANPQAGINAIQKLVSVDKVFSLLGPDYSSVTYPSLFVTKEAKVPQFTSSTAPKITLEGHEWVMRLRSNDDIQAERAVSYMVQDLGIPKIALAYTTNEYGQTGAECAEKSLKDLGLTPLAKVSHNFGDKDLTASATKIMESGADGVIGWGTQAEHSLLLKVLLRLGYKGRFLYSTTDEIFAKLLTPNELKGVLGVLAWVDADTSDKSKEFVKNYKAKWGGSTPETHAAAYYDGVYTIKHGIEQVGLDQTKFRDFWRNIDGWVGVQGKFKADPKHNGDMQTYLDIVEFNANGVPVVKKKFD